jgi:hypothetical protein
LDAQVSVVGHEFDPIDGTESLFKGRPMLHFADQNLTKELTIPTGGVQKGLGGVDEQVGRELVQYLLDQRCRGKYFARGLDAQGIPLDPRHIDPVAYMVNEII